MGLSGLDAAAVVMVFSVPSVDNLVLFLRKFRSLEWFHVFSLTGHLRTEYQSMKYIIFL